MELLQDVVAHWAAKKPDQPAVIGFDRDQSLTWRELDGRSTALAGDLESWGVAPGDFVAAWLPFSPEHVLLEYACFKLGAVHVPLDLRLKPAELLRYLGLVRPKLFSYPATFRGQDLSPIAAAVRPYVPNLVEQDSLVGRSCAPRASSRSRPSNSSALVIFTTGSTGSPKPALLSHRNILTQNHALGHAFGFNEHDRLLVNLPPSHIGGQAEALMTTLYWGGTAVLLEAFDPVKSLEAISRHRVTVLGQIPAMFHYEWRVPAFAGYDLSSLRAAFFGGQQVTPAFVDRLRQMAPRAATGLGLTEAAGFCTYTGPEDDLAGGIGRADPSYPLSIREPMREDGLAGSELPAGATGHICFQGPQTFLGYVNDPEATARTISRDGYLYTGDLGYLDAAGLHFAGRAKWVIKPAGHQVFPGDVENHLCALEGKVSACGVVGAEHRLLSEAIVAFVERRPEADLTVQELRKHARQLSSHMRPLHYVLLEPGQMPLNRVVKTDYVRLSELAAEEVARLRAAGRWDV